jgi:hypothetical protein
LIINEHKENNKLIFLISLIIFILLNLIYRFSISPIYSYMGFSLNSYNFYELLFAIPCVLIISYFSVFKANSEFSKILSQLIIFLFTFPSLILYINTNISIDISIAHLLFFFISFYIINYIKIKPLSIEIKKEQKIIFLLFFIILITIPFLFFFINKINFKNLLLIDIYETRSIQRNTSNVLLDYSYSQMTNVLLPITLIYFLSKKYFFSSFFLSIIFLFFFLIGAHKSVLFGFLGILFFSKFKDTFKYLPFIIFFILILDLVLFFFFNNYFLSNIISRRVFFVPALLDKFYFTFFANKPMYWSASFLSNFIDNPYDLTPAYIIGKYYFNDQYMSSNNGLISDGFTNLGWVGIIINIFIFSFYFSYLKALNISKLYFSIIILIMISFLSSALPVVFLTHGGFLLLLIFQLILKDSANLK